jgi:hypothetical protein
MAIVKNTTIKKELKLKKKNPKRTQTTNVVEDAGEIS